MDGGSDVTAQAKERRKSFVCYRTRQGSEELHIKRAFLLRGV
jgi:hypothetical protein